MTWLWIPILVIWTKMIVKGYQRGFLKMVLSLVVAVLLIWRIGPTVEWIIIEKIPMLKQAEEVLQSAIGTEKEELQGQTSEKQGLPLFDFIREALLVWFLMKMAEKLLGEFETIPIIGWINRLGGVCLGMIKGVVCLWIFFWFVSVLVHTSTGAMLYKEISEDPYLNYLYKNNLLIQYLVSMFE